MAVSVQRRERSNYAVKLDGSNIGFRSPQALYGSILGQLGVVLVSDRFREFVTYGKASEYLPRLRLKLGRSRGAASGLGNQSQGDGRASALVFVNPKNITTCLGGSLKGKSARGKAILDCKIPKKRVLI